MKQIIIAVTFLTTSFLFSCNKPDNKAKPNTPTSSGISGILLSTKIEIDSTYPFQPASVSQIASADFYSTPSNKPTILVDTVYVNNMGLEALTDTMGGFDLGYYENSPLLDMDGICNWQVVGNATIPSFSYNFNVPYPSFTGSLPDTFSLANGLSFNLNFNGADSVVVEFSSIGIHSSPVIRKSYSPTTTQINFSANDLVNVSPSSIYELKSILTIYTYKYSTQSFGNKDFLFMKTYQKIYGIWVEP